MTAPVAPLQKAGFGISNGKIVKVGGGPVVNLGDVDNGVGTPKQIAQELVAPTKKRHLFVVGDSTQTNMQAYALNNCPEIAWTGTLALFFNSLPVAGAHTTSLPVAPITGKSLVSPWLGGTCNWFCTIVGAETKFLGGAEPISGDNCTLMRTAYISIDQATYPLLWAGLIGKGATVRSLVYRHGLGQSGNPGLALHNRVTGTNFAGAGNVLGSYLLDSRARGLAQVSTRLPTGYDFATYTTLNLEMVAKPGASTVANEVVPYTTPWIEADGPGIVYFPLAQGGWSIDGWLDITEIPVTFWTETLPAIADDPIFYIDIGVNNPGGNSQARHEELLEKLIHRVRLVFPDAPIILGTAHENSTSGSSPYFRLAAIAVASRVDGCLLLDTMAAMGTYAAGVAAGYYGDTVHYNATGNSAKWAKIGDLVAAAAVA